MHVALIFQQLVNGIMKTPKRWFLSLVFTCILVLKHNEMLIYSEDDNKVNKICVINGKRCTIYQVQFTLNQRKEVL